MRVKQVIPNGQPDLPAQRLKVLGLLSKPIYKLLHGGRVGNGIGHKLGWVSPRANKLLDQGIELQILRVFDPLVHVPYTVQDLLTSNSLITQGSLHGVRHGVDDVLAGS